MMFNFLFFTQNSQSVFITNICQLRWIHHVIAMCYCAQITTISLFDS